MKNTRKNTPTRKCLGVNAQWIKYFSEVASGRAGRDWTDAEISAKMKAAFPGRKSKIFNQVGRVRGRFNRGVLNGQEGPPKKKAVKIED